jgi:hypothetical protein
VDEIVACLRELKRIINQTDSENYNRDLAACVFRITAILKRDLYGKGNDNDYIPKDIDLFAHLECKRTTPK